MFHAEPAEEGAENAEIPEFTRRTPRAFSLHALREMHLHLVQFFQLRFEVPRQDRKPTPASRVNIEVVQVKGGSKSFALPLIGSPSLKKLFYIALKLRHVQFTGEMIVYLNGRQALKYGEVFDLQQDGIRHQVFLVGLSLIRWS